MNFKDALSTVELVIEAGDVPLLIGESGIGKTSLIRELAIKNRWSLVSIDANLLKEGEIGGLPTVSKRKFVLGNETIERNVTEYATHSKLIEVDNFIDNGHKVLLFIDELNRCEHTVQQELMNLILNREINGYNLHKDVYVIAAMNPSNKYDDFESSEYQVVDMDPAQEDRFVWIQMEVDIKEWLKWAMTDGEIHEHIIEFLSSFPDYLHTPNAADHIKATPRSWERVSKGYKIFLKNKESVSRNIFYNLVKGNIGVAIAGDFISFIDNIKNPLIKPEDIFKEDILTFDIKDRISRENHSRLYIISKNCLSYLEDLKNRKGNITIFSEVLKLYPKDLRLGIMKEIKNDCSSDLYLEFLNNEEFLEAFFDIYSR
ncbi:ATP-binding protein [Clostridium sp. 'White wine YQ']|uniref:ATP-binding protein n=1 Tax=Clostridium sp. 'White wine YQ' TaxID=3027474 RepID=UPI0023668B5E|nr:ATP-binding protein [Clostridium sp. 'White wine YQ']MDD7794951.1 ATP-binding protein [Clostridium sp. 'White wine YQ']